MPTTPKGPIGPNGDRWSILRLFGLGGTPTGPIRGHESLGETRRRELGASATPKEPVAPPGPIGGGGAPPEPKSRQEVMSNIDRYLLHAFDAVEDELQHETEAGGGTKPEVIRLPMLVQVRGGASLDPGQVPDGSVIAQVGSTVAILGSRDTVAALQRNPIVLGIEASRPGSGLDCIHSVPFVHADVVHGGAFSEEGDEALIAIIDHDIDVLHHAFRDSQGKTRIRAVWDQTDRTGPGPMLGEWQTTEHTESQIKWQTTEHTESQINQYIQSGSVPPGLKRVSDGHGTHVASIAAGSPVGTQFPGGVAPKAKIIVVIPALKVGPTDLFSLGYSTSHIAALAYIKDFAERENLPVVVNLSQGMNAGAHDGTSGLEAAFDAFTEGGRAPGRVVVKSAGNERNQDGHAKIKLGNKQSESLEWYSSEHHGGKDVVELWFKSCDEMKFILQDPTGAKSSQVTWSNHTENGEFSSGSGNRYFITYDRYHQDNGDSCLRVTITRGTSPSIVPGTWILKIESGTIKSQGEIHAWIEKDIYRPISFRNHLSEEMTLSIPGTARTVISVGSVAASRPFRVANYSSYGPTRDGRDKPELAAPGENITAAKGNSLVDIRTDSGTSLAAPHVTGAIALLFSHWEKKRSKIPDWKQLNAAQIRAAISQMTQEYNGHCSPGLGFGVLDVEKLLSAFTPLLSSWERADAERGQTQVASVTHTNLEEIPLQVAKE